MDIYECRGALNAGKTIYDLPLRVTYYARVSTDKDEQLHSLSAQVQYFSDFIRRCPSWTFVEGYIDEGISGTSASKRENFMRMIGDARKGRFDFVVTKEISRFSRNTLDSIRYTQELLKCGVGVFFQSDNINTLMPDAELRLTIMSSIAQDEVRKISERVKFGFKRAIEKGTVLGNNRIWGYRKQDGRLVIDEAEAGIIRMIFDLYANHQMGVRTIAARLAESGYTNSRGNPFSFSTIRGILCNPKYKGYYCGGKSSKVDYKLNKVKNFDREDWVVYRDEENVPPIVSEELWEKANRLLAERSAKQSAPDKTSYQNKYPYSGKILCGIHHVPYYRGLYRYESGNKEVWQCQEYVKAGKEGCSAPVVYTAELDSIMRQALAETAVRREEIVQKLTGLYAAVGREDETERTLVKYRTQLDEIRRRKDKLLDLGIAGRITDEELSERNDRFNAELEAIDRQMEALEGERRKKRETLHSLESLRQAIDRELEFENGFSPGVIDALLERMEIFDTGDKGRIRVGVYLKTAAERHDYLIRRRHRKPSVCTRQYT